MTDETLRLKAEALADLLFLVINQPLRVERVEAALRETAAEALEEAESMVQDARGSSTDIQTIAFNIHRCAAAIRQGGQRG